LTTGPGAAIYLKRSDAGILSLGGPVQFERAEAYLADCVREVR
jgi:hypothetical protein